MKAETYVTALHQGFVAIRAEMTELWSIEVGCGTAPHAGNVRRFLPLRKTQNSIGTAALTLPMPGAWLLTNELS